MNNVHYLKSIAIYCPECGNVGGRHHPNCPENDQEMRRKRSSVAVRLSTVRYVDVIHDENALDEVIKGKAEDAAVSAELKAHGDCEECEVWADAEFIYESEFLEG